MSKDNRDMSGTENERKSRGRSREGASFPVPREKIEVPAEYAAVLDELKNRIQSERLRVTMAANRLWCSCIGISAKSFWIVRSVRAGELKSLTASLMTLKTPFQT